MGTAAQRGTARSSPNPAVAHESTSPHIVGPWHVGLLLLRGRCPWRQFLQDEWHQDGGQPGTSDEGLA